MPPVPTSRRLVWVVAAGLVAFAFWPALFAGGSLVSADMVATSPPFDSYQPASFSLENGPGDPINIHAHWASLAADIRGGDVTWWNPDLAAGQPTMKAGAPVFGLPYLVTPDWYAPGLVAAIRVLVAIGLAFGFLRAHELHRLSALTGAIAFGFSGFMVGWMNWPHSSVAALAPGLLWAIERLIRDPRAWRAVPLGGVVALMVWANFPSVLIYVLLGAAAYTAVRLADEWRRDGGVRWILPRGAVTVAAVVVAATLAGPHIIGFGDYMAWADTSHRIGNPDDSSAGIAYLMTSVAPAIWGSDAVGPAWFGEGNWVEFNAHVGASVTLLAAFGLVSGIRSGPGRRRSLAAALTVIAGLGVLIAYLGGPVAVRLGDLTGSEGGLMTRAKVLWSLGVALGAALGVERLLDPHPTTGRRDVAWTGAVVAGGALVLVPSTLDWLDAARAAGVVREVVAVSTVPVLAALASIALVVARVRGRVSAGLVGAALSHSGQRARRRQVHRADLGRQLLHHLQRAPVEGQDRRALGQAGLAHGRDQRARKGLGRHRLVGLVGAQLGFQRQPHLRVAALLHQGEQLVQPRNARAVARLLRRVQRGIARTGLQPADVVALQFGEVGVPDHRPARVQELPVRPARDVGVQGRVVRDHQHAVSRDGDVGLQRRHAQTQGQRKSGQGVLGRQAARAAVALQVEGLCLQAQAEQGKADAAFHWRWRWRWRKRWARLCGRPPFRSRTCQSLCQLNACAPRRA